MKIHLAPRQKVCIYNEALLNEILEDSYFTEKIIENHTIGFSLERTNKKLLQLLDIKYLVNQSLEQGIISEVEALSLSIQKDISTTIGNLSQKLSQNNAA